MYNMYKCPTFISIKHNVWDYTSDLKVDEKIESLWAGCSLVI